MDWEEIIKAESSEELKEAKLWLFQENMRLEQERLRIEQERLRLEQEHLRIEQESNAFKHRCETERKRLKEENLFFDKKMAILQEGFRNLEEDRRMLEREHIRMERERELLSERDNIDYYGEGCSIVEILFRNATNPLALRKRYKDLVKIFHPDNLAGDEELVQMINREFAKRRREEA